MKMKSKNITTLILMISSVLLLIVFQVFWIRSSYEKAFYDFRRETNILFRTSVLGMRDSLFAKNIQQVPSDSIMNGVTAYFTMETDSLKLKSDASSKAPNQVNIRAQTSKVQVFVSHDDSINVDMLRPIASKIQSSELIKRKKGAKSYVVRLLPDSLNRDSLHYLVSKVMERSEITNPFFIQYSIHPEPDDMDFPGIPPPLFLKSLGRHSPGDSVSIFSDTVRTDAVKFNPVHAYTASFIDVQSTLLQKITPQILFSIFLTLMIAGAFALMYRNILAQQKLMELKNDFISNVSHELKTPVATVSVALEALKNFQALNDQKLTEEYLDIAQRELGRLTVMTDKILKASVFESKGGVFSPEKINFNTLLEDVLKSNKVVFEKRGAVVTVTREGNSFEVYGSAGDLSSVIHNLIDNALKYSTNTPVIDIQLSATDKNLSFTIKDHGIGIPAEFQKKIFEKFFRVPTGDVHNIKGYGLGLSHVINIIQNHNGKIEVASKPGEGSTFMVTLKKSTDKFNNTIPS